MASVLAIPRYPSTASQAVLCNLMWLVSRNSTHQNVVRCLIVVMALFCTTLVDGVFYMGGYYAGKVMYGYGVAVQGGRGGWLLV
jgi:hypothetical protein